MATISDINKIPYSGDIRVDSLLMDLPANWNYLLPAGRTTLYYTFDCGVGSVIDAATAEALTTFNVTQKTAANSILSYIGSLIGITFTETPSGTTADFHFGAINISGTTTSGLCYTTSGPIAYNPATEVVTSYLPEAFVYLDNVEFASSNNNPTAGSSGYETLLHEIGHALGLGHPFDGTYRLPAVNDNTNNTVMSYTSAGGYKTTFQSYDLLTLTWIYGGDGLMGTYGYNSTNGPTLLTTPPVVPVVDDYTSTTVTTGLVSVGGSTTGSIETSGDADWFKVSLTAGTSYAFTLAKTTTGLADPYLRLYNPSAVQVAVDDNGGGTPNAKISYTPTVSGTYYLAAADASTGTGAYTLAAAITAVADTTAPTATSFSPADEATGVVVSSNIVVTFSEPIAKGAGNIVLKTAGVIVATYDAATSANLAFSGSTLTLNPTTDLTAGTAYSVEFAAGSVKDLAGNAYAGTTTYNFTTATGTTPPTPSGLSKAKVYLGAGGDIFTVSSSGITVNGNLGTDAIRINAGVTNVKTDANIERIELTAPVASYKFVVVPGTGLQIQNASGSVIATMPSLNQDTTLVFSDGSAALSQTGMAAFSLGGISVSTTAATAIAAPLNTADTASLVGAGSSKSKVYLGAGGDTFDVNSSGATINGNLGADTLRIYSGITGIRTDANVERIELSAPLASYKFVVVPGTGMQIQNAGGSVVATMSSLNQDTTLAFSDGSAVLSQTGMTAFSLGGMAIGTTPGTIAATLLSSDKSTIGASSGPAVVTINTASGTVTDGGAGVNTAYTIASGNYNATIAGFGVGDTLSFFAGAVISVQNASPTDGSLSVNASTNGQTTTITLTGLTTTQDGAIFNTISFNTVFGVGSLTF